MTRTRAVVNAMLWTSYRRSLRASHLKAASVGKVCRSVVGRSVPRRRGLATRRFTQELWGEPDRTSRGKSRYEQSARAPRGASADAHASRVRLRECVDWYERDRPRRGIECRRVLHRAA